MAVKFNILKVNTIDPLDVDITPVLLEVVSETLKLTPYKAGVVPVGDNTFYFINQGEQVVRVVLNDDEPPALYESGGGGN